MAGSEDTREAELRRIGEALGARTEDVVQGMARRTRESGTALDEAVEERFERVGAVSTTAVARWMAGEGAQVAREVGQESWRIFGQLAAQRAAPLNEVTKRCLRWCDSTSEVLGEVARELRVDDDVLSHACEMLRRSLNVTLVRMCESFEAERRRTDEELTFLATHDALTGLPNRTLIVDRIEQMLVRSRHSQSPVAALFIDLDNFKDINDTLGHSAGDELLCAVAARLDGVVRDLDALGRLGGDEFVVIAGELSLAAGPELIAERMLDALKQPFKLQSSETPFTVTASIGIAAGQRMSAEELLRDADIAMYRAKWDGKNRYVVFESRMQDAVQSRLELEMDLRAALQRQEFFLVYQPTVDLHDMRPTGVEALLRWQHPVRGVVEPDDFIGTLEETGLIVEIGTWVLHEACRQGASWRRAGLELEMSVNVSARQLDSDQLIVEVKRALVTTDLEPGALVLEITETALMRDARETVRRLEAIKSLGVRIAIDDFGTGYSSLAHLRQFPVDALKIDRSFITGVTRNNEGEALIHTLVQLGKALSIKTLAEGIEREHELSLLQGELCDSGQGFLFAKPLDAVAVEELLQSWAASQAPAATSATR
ncbi:MAG TPA: EAL domain-containing protein [Solirubrobacteraceae bacterium]|nr:EAL domain-containing protein [Solirubrobacteraceae bacterium]